jgi:hypothetical protein
MKKLNLYADRVAESYDPSDIEYNLREDIYFLKEEIKNLSKKIKQYEIALVRVHGGDNVEAERLAEKILAEQD